MAAPGDRVDSAGIVEPGPHHAHPPCRHFPECGGCQLQHVDDEGYAGFLVDRVAWALSAQGLEPAEIRRPHLSPPRSRRRASLSAERRGNQLLVGFKAEGSHRIVDMRECHILRPELFALVGPLRPLLLKLLPNRRGGSVRMTLADQGVDVLIEGIEATGLDAVESLAAFAAEHRLARLALDSGLGPETLWEPDPVTVTLGGTAVGFPHNGFLQATVEGEKVLVAAVGEAVGPAATVADLFAGVGTFALALGPRVLAVEGDRNAALALRAAAQRGERQIFVDHRDLYRRPLDMAELDRFDAVVLDPPRAGAVDQSINLARSRVPRIAYVSCNPATFGRDAKALVEGGYGLSWVQPVGQFRWSTHVELVAFFEHT